MPPNVLWICADDYTPDALGAYGRPLARTPHLDRLAAAGARLGAAFANCPLSTPARQAFWTGRYPRSIGVTLSRTPLPDDEITLPARLRAAGYETAAFGKTHYYYPRLDEFDVRLDVYEYRQWLGAKGADPLPPGVRTLGDWRPFHDPPAVWLNAGVLPYPATDADTFGTYLADRAAEYLARPRPRPRPRPFFCYVSFHETHSPFNFPADWPDRRSADEFSAPPVAPADQDELPAEFRKLSEADRRGVIAAYHTCAAFMDRNAGRVLAALDAAGLAADTLVLFTSDHGYLLGQHGRFEKHCCYDPATRAAVLARWPGVIPAGRSSAALVELLDLAPTVLDACGLPVPSEMHGRSLLPLLAGKTDAHRDRVFVEYADNAEAAVRTDRWKLIYCAGTRVRHDGYAGSDQPPGPWVKLFDLHADPDESTNLAGRPDVAAVEAELFAALADHVLRTTRRPVWAPPDPDPQWVLERNLDPRDDDLFTYLRRKHEALEWE
jgi:choline-sulfatase